jgi:O-antigen/teichoic acid export membrane protein
MKLSRMFAMLVGLVGLRVIGAILNLLSQLVFTRTFAPADVGAIMLAMSTTAFISLFTSVGYPWLAFTQLPRFAALGLPNVWNRFHGAFLRDGTVAYLLFVAAVSLVIAVVPLSDTMKLALIIGSCAAPASMLLRYDSSVANSLRRFTLSYAPDFVFRALLILAFVLLAPVFGYKLTVLHVTIGFVVVLYVVGIGQALILGKKGVTASNWFDAKPSFTRKLRLQAMPLSVVAAVATSFSDIVTLLGGFLLPADDVALLGVAIRLAAIAGFVIQVVQQFLLPDLAEAITKRSAEKTHALLLRMNILTIGTIGAGLIATLIFGRWALSLFGAAYVPAFAILILFMVGQSIRALSGMNQQILSIEGHQLRTAGSCIVALIVLLSVSALATHQFGLIGIGVGTIAAELVWGLLLASQAQQKTGQRGDMFWLLAKRP